MSTAVAQNGMQPGAVEMALIGGDLGKLTPDQRLDYYRQVCQSLGLNPLTKPFDYITLNGKLTLYARKDCTEQLRSIRKISVRIMAREVVEGCYVVTARASTPDGREDESVGAVPIEGLKHEARSNAMMKAETKAKRRVTLSICGLGILDEIEVDSIHTATPASARPAATQTASIPDKQPIPSEADEAEIIREHAKALEEADTLQELSAAWDSCRTDKRIGIEDKTKLAKVKDERKAAMLQTEAAA